MKKLLSFLLAFLLLAGLCVPALAEGEQYAPADEEDPAAAADQSTTEPDVYAEGGEEILPQDGKSAYGSGSCGAGGSNVTWSVEDGEGGNVALIISGSGRMRDYDDKADLPWYSLREKIDTIVVRNGVSYIGDNAFADCYRAVSVTIPNSVTELGNNIFNSCSKLESVIIPDSVTLIDGNALFSGCHNLTSVSFPRNSKTTYSDTNTMFFDCLSLKSIELPSGMTCIGDHMFFACDELENVVIPDSVTKIGYDAFLYCISLRRIVIPNSVTEIGFSAFEGCSALEDVSLPGSVGTIQMFTFEDCTSLTRIVIPEGVETIELYAFRNCENLRSVSLPLSLREIEEGAFASYDYTSKEYGRLPLEEVRYAGSRGQWEKISIGSDNPVLSDYNIFRFASNDAAAQPGITVSADARRASAVNFTGLYARVALVIDNNGASGLYVTQVMINTDGTILIPTFMIPGLTVKGVNVALVPTLEDIQKSMPTVMATDSKMLG